MDILTFVKQFYLHDSSVENIGYAFFKDQFIITVNLCNWMQISFNKNIDPDHIIGNFIFKGVKDIELKPQNFTYYSHEILNVDYKQIEYDLYEIKLVIKVFTANKSFAGSPVVVLSFRAKEVEWVPLDSYFN